MHIILIEPNPFLQDIIRANVSNIWPVPTILNVALGDSPGSSSFNIRGNVVQDQGASHLAHVMGEASQKIKVEVDTVDNIVERNSFIPDLIKLDLQGGELAALNGAQQTLQHAELVIFEFSCLEA